MNLTDLATTPRITVPDSVFIRRCQECGVGKDAKALLALAKAGLEPLVGGKFVGVKVVDE